MTLTFDLQYRISSFSAPSERIVVLYYWDSALKRMRRTDWPGIYHLDLSKETAISHGSNSAHWPSSVIQPIIILNPKKPFLFQRPPISKIRQSSYWQETWNCSLIWLWLLLWSLDTKRCVTLLNSAWAPSMKSWVGPAGETLHMLRRLQNHKVHTVVRNQSTTSIPVKQILVNRRYIGIGIMVSISANISLILLYIKFIPVKINLQCCAVIWND